MCIGTVSIAAGWMIRCRWNYLPSARGLQSETVGTSLHKPVVSTPVFTVLPNSRSLTARLTWMLCAEQVFARCASAEGVWRGQLAWAIKRPDQVRTIAKI